jgi:transcriptional regulator with XRE-family HTH domain
MPYIYYGEYIKNAREKAGLSMERCAEGICSVQTLYRVENNKAGISSIVFQAIMSRCGQSAEVFPIFESWADYDCFSEMYKLDMWLDSWQVGKAYDCIKRIEELNFAENKLYYQKWLYCYASMLSKAVSSDYPGIGKMLEKALSISKPYMELKEMSEELFTETEIRILILIAENCILNGAYKEAEQIIKQLETIMSDQVGDREYKELLLIEIRKVSAILYLVSGKNKEALCRIKEVRQALLKNSGGETNLDVTFFYGLSEYLAGVKKTGLRYMRAACYSSDAIGAQFARKAITWLDTLGLKIPEVEETLEYCSEKEVYALPDLERKLEEESREAKDKELITYGKILKRRRKEQKVSAKVISQGICTESYYSKIENDKAFPDVFLARELMQRLGISSAPFTFYVGKSEEEYHFIENMMVGIERFNPDKIQEILDEVGPIILSSENNILIQWYEILRVFHVDNRVNKSEAILKKIQITLEKFEIEDIMNYRLSRNEVLNALAYCLAQRYDTNISSAIAGLNYLMRYLRAAYVEELYNKSIKSMIMAALINMLGIQDRHSEILELEHEVTDSIILADLYHLPTILAHLSLAWLTQNNAYSTKKYALFAYYLFVLNDRRFSENFKANLERKIGYKLEYCY